MEAALNCVVGIGLLAGLYSVMNGDFDGIVKKIGQPLTRPFVCIMNMFNA